MAPAGVWAQQAPAPRFAAVPAAPIDALVQEADPIRPIHPAAAFLASAVLPGAGQGLLGSERWALYAALELWGWIAYLDQRSAGGDLEGEYRDLAWFVARRISTGPRRDGGFEYYERLAQFDASGAFDARPEESGIQPETDERTFNGQVWRLAREFYLGGQAPGSVEGQAAALRYYAENAVPPQLAWRWGDNLLELELYRSLIRRSDEAYRDATSVLGVILANHVVSAVDALILARLRRQHDAVPELRAATRADARDRRWDLQLRFRLPRP